MLPGCNLFATLALKYGLSVYWFQMKTNILLSADDLKAEEELVKRAQHNRETFGELYELYYTRIFNFSLRRTANVQLAMDITSATFLKALREIKKFRWRDVPFSAWLYRVAGNEINDYYRRQGRREERLEDAAQLVDATQFSDEIAEAEEELGRHEEYLLLHEKVAELPQIYQEVIALKFFERKKIREMVGILGKKEGTIKSLLHRGLEKLREKMA
jgi:RNA polymerase sigma-70 factor (ECF subfamily)